MWTVKYEFADGMVSEVEVEDSIGAVVIEDRRLEDSLFRKERYHCYSLDAVQLNLVCHTGYRKAFKKHSCIIEEWEKE